MHYKQQLKGMQSSKLREICERGMNYRRYTKGLPFRQKWYIKGKGFGPRSGASLYKTLLSSPPPRIESDKIRQDKTMIFLFGVLYQLVHQRFPNTSQLQ